MPLSLSGVEIIVPEIVKYDETHTIIHVHIPPSAEVHRYKKVIYDRVDDADVKITSTGAIAQLYIRKQNIFTEKRIYPYSTLEDLRLDLLPKIRIMAKNRAAGAGLITVNNLEPNPKNPMIAAFFRNIGYADQLGSGVRNLFKYSKYYSGAEPSFEEEDVFRIIVPLNDAYSFDFGRNGQTNQSDQTELTVEEKMLLKWIKQNPDMTNILLAESLDWSVSKVKYYIQKLKQANKIKRVGTSRKGQWEII